ncbi:MAG: maltose alpha-D-glucosyltransferase [Rhodospirillales bacterium]
MIDRTDRHWYLDAVVYQLHVKAFHDADNDGVGDFRGLTEKLDHLQSLGVTALWLLPFYPSPLKDDGYDIADYRAIHPSYGSMKDFRAFLRAAHDRGLRVITELVINHTSDQHPWFQRARRARPGSAARTFYVWSETDRRYQGTRIIFLDTETSNWTWDPMAGAYFWHRFYGHQPDLNFDNPAVLKEVLNAMRFWLDEGVDGLRLDAVPYLIEREGTNNENLPETHDVLKRIRAEVDRHYPDRMLLAEANQWPEDVRPYFGDGDECHMSFHFPLMPRMYMALAQEDRYPITDIMRQTPEIPPGCQWAIFLRNHDELTLEMVTDRERDSLWNFYAGDRRMRINLGIRRRLAPLMENDRRRIELLNSLLFSMPGTPIVYYGDEIGMGDNIYLGDRDGVRTPMQWSPDRNGGFSRADPARLYLPAIQDPIYGFQAVNVEAQTRSPASLLNWMKRLIAVRQQRRAFGRGTLRFLYPGNRKVLAYLREYVHPDGTEETILCVANVSRAPQAVELDLKQFKGLTPIELLGRTAFPPIGDLTYLLTMPGYGFYWFALSREAAVPDWHVALPEPMPELVTLVLTSGWSALDGGRAGRDLADVLPTFLPKQRWFAARDRAIASVRLATGGAIRGEGDGWFLGLYDVAFADGGEPERVFLPLSLSFDPEAGNPGWPLLPFTIARGRRGARVGAVHDAMADGRFALAAVEAIREGRILPVGDGRVACRPTGRFVQEEPLAPDTVAERIGVEQANSSVIIGQRFVAKAYRRLVAGVHPEVEIGRFLTEVAGYANTPALMGTIEFEAADGTPTALAIVQAFVRNQGDGWAFTRSYLERELEDVAMGVTGTDGAPRPPGDHCVYVALADRLGLRIAELHRAFAVPTDDPAFAAEPVSADDLAAWHAAARRQAEAAFDVLAGLGHDVPAGVREDAGALAGRREEALALLDAVAPTAPGGLLRTRIHGDLHLGQVFRTGEDFQIIDFEGEPSRSLAERRAKRSPLRDVAGLLRSFDHAAWSAQFALAEHGIERSERVAAHAEAWRRKASAAFLSSYRRAMAGAPGQPDAAGATDGLLTLFLLEKACYEIVHEATNRPGWLCIPIRGVAALLDQHALAPATP